MCIDELYLYLYTYILIGSTVQTGQSPLYMASSEGHTEVVDKLLKHGADPNMATFVRVRLMLKYHHDILCTSYNTERVYDIHDCMRYLLVSKSSIDKLTLPSLQ